MARMADHAPQPRRVPLPSAGVGLLYLVGRPDIASRIRERYGKAARVSIPGFGKCVAVADPVLVKQVFTAPADVLHSGDSSPLSRTLGRNSIFALDEDVH